MARRTFDLLAEPVGELYYSLLDFALTECRLALLVRDPSHLSEDGEAVLRQLQPFLRRTVESGEWPGSKLLPPATLPVLWYEYTPGCAEVLKRTADRLYAWTKPELPDDLCLLRDEDDPWLVTISHEHDGYLCLSLDERSRLVQALPRVAPMLRDARCREESRGPALEVQRFLSAWDPHGWLRDDLPEGEYGPEAQAVLYAVASSEVGTEAELAHYIAAMLARWSDEYASVTAEDCATLARAVWAWWQKRRGHRGQG